MTNMMYMLTEQTFYINGVWTTLQGAFMSQHDVHTLEKMLKQRRTVKSTTGKLKQSDTRKRLKMMFTPSIKQVGFTDEAQLYRMLHNGAAINNVSPSFKHVLKAWNETEPSEDESTKRASLQVYADVNFPNDEYYISYHNYAKKLCSWFYVNGSSGVQRKIDASLSLTALAFGKFRKDHKLLGSRVRENMIRYTYSNSASVMTTLSTRMGVVFHELYALYKTNLCSYDFVEWSMCLFYLKTYGMQQRVPSKPVAPEPCAKIDFINGTTDDWCGKTWISTMHVYAYGYKQLVSVFVQVLEYLKREYANCEFGAESEGCVTYNTPEELYNGLIAEPRHVMFSDLATMMDTFNTTTVKCHKARAPSIYQTFYVIVWKVYHLMEDAPEWGRKNRQPIVLHK